MYDSLIAVAVKLRAAAHAEHPLGALLDAVGPTEGALAIVVERRLVVVFWVPHGGVELRFRVGLFEPPLVFAVIIAVGAVWAGWAGHDPPPSAAEGWASVAARLSVPCAARLAFAAISISFVQMVVRECFSTSRVDALRERGDLREGSAGLGDCALLRLAVAA
jgi:hypothetical protein